MTTINSIEDLMRVLDENPEWLEAMRVRLLTRELIELPRVVANLAKSMDERFDEAAQQLARIDERFAQVDRRFDKLESELQALRDDIAPMKGTHARNVTIEQADLLVEAMGLTWRRTLAHLDIAELVRSSDTSGIPNNELISFRLADLIVECADAAGETCYAAVEASFTVNGRDTRRAMRNAEYLERFTGRPARAAVAGERIDDRTQEDVESGGVFWYPLDPLSLSVAAE